MAEEIKDVSEENSMSSQEKQTNRTFTQSELDRMVAEAINKTKSKYEDYEDVKTNYQSLLKEKEDKELAEKSELEKAMIASEKLQSELEQAKNTIQNYKLIEIKNSVLNSDDRFKSLPEIYRNSIKLTDNEDDLRSSAEEIYNIFKKDHGASGESFGSGKKETVINNIDNQSKSLAQQVAEKWKARFR